MDYSQYKQIEFRRKFWKLFGAQINVVDPASQQQLGLIRMKAWKLKEDIRLYRDASQTEEIMRIGARSVIDFGATYDVFDSPTNQQLLSARRKGLRSTFVRDHWLLLDTSGNEFGYVQETSSLLALARRWIELVPFGEFVGLALAFVPQTYAIYANDSSGTSKLAGTINHRKNPIVVKLDLDTSGAEVLIDGRIPVAVVALLSVIDASKS